MNERHELVPLLDLVDDDHAAVEEREPHLGQREAVDVPREEREVGEQAAQRAEVERRLAALPGP